jgi:hypothetical protein
MTIWVSTAASQSALGTKWSNTVTVTQPTGSVDLNVSPGRWISYKMLIGIPAGAASSVIPKEIKISPAVENMSTSANGSASPILKDGDQLQLTADFAVDMANTTTCDFIVNTEDGNSFTITGGTWLTSRRFTSSAYTITSGMCNGFADVYVRKGITVAGKEIFYYYPRCFVIDNAGIIPSGKNEFFPNPFSPNNDGNADATNMILSLDSSKEVTLRIYNLKGLLVRTLKENEVMQGNVVITWDGKDESSRSCPIGLYIYSLKLGEDVTRGTVVLSK